VDLPKPIVGTIVDHQVMGLPIRWQERLLGVLALQPVHDRLDIGARCISIGVHPLAPVGNFGNPTAIIPTRRWPV